MSGVMLNLEGSLITNLEAWLAANGSLCSGIAYPNKEFTTPNVDASKAWLRCSFFPKETQQASVGDDGMNEMGGIMLLNVFYPKGQNAGAGPAKAVADSLVSAFKRGTNCASNSGYVARVQKSWQGASLPEEAWFNIPVNVQWYQHVTNT